MNNKSIKKVLASILVISMAFGFTGLPRKAQTVTAVVTNVATSNAKTVNLQIDGNISGITDPSAPADNAAWSGSKVYFGKYDNKPVLFRVLDANTTDYSAYGTTKTMLLDSDILFQPRKFNASVSDNSWANSDIKAWMQGTGSDQFLNQFSAVEQGSIIASNKSEPSATDGTKFSNGAFAPLENDKVFALDAVELRNTSYGYSNVDRNGTLPIENRIKKSNNVEKQWWTRSPVFSGSSNLVSFIHTNGLISNIDVSAGSELYLSPAMNLNLSSILYASASGQNKGSFAATEDSNSNTWNLTLAGGKGFTATLSDSAIAKNENIVVNITDLGKTLNGSELVDGYYSQLSAMLVDKDGTVLAYGKISDTVATGNVSFAVPEGIEKGSYTLKVFAEKVNSSDSNNVTDYASNMASFEITYPIDAKNINLQINGNISGITDPSAPELDANWSGSKVYFGKYDDNPLVFRVLDASTTDYSLDKTTKTMLLDSEVLLFELPFDNGKTDNLWANSDIKAWMQGTGSDQFLNQFSAVERGSIIASNKSEPSATDGTKFSNGAFAPLENDKVFALDAVELRNTSYGYSNVDRNGTLPIENRIKKSNNVEKQWWTRSPVFSGSSNLVSFIHTNGLISNADISGGSKLFVSPAMNLSLSSILYASAIGTTQTAELDEVGSNFVANNEWKLTLLDNSKTVGIQENKYASKDGSTVTVPYTFNGNGVNQISVMITSTERTNAAAQVLYYGKLATVSGSNGSGSATFTLPENLPEGYKVYLIAEEINSGNGTNYASNPVEVDIKVVYQSLYSGAYVIDFDNGAIINGVEYAKGDTINVTGEYEIMYTESGVEYKGTLVLYRLGDLNVNNVVNIADLVAMDEHLNNERELSLSGYKAADITADNTIDEKDFNQLVQYLLSK